MHYLKIHAGRFLVMGISITPGVMSLKNIEMYSLLFTGLDKIVWDKNKERICILLGM